MTKSLRCRFQETGRKDNPRELNWTWRFLLHRPKKNPKTTAHLLCDSSNSALLFGFTLLPSLMSFLFTEARSIFKPSAESNHSGATSSQLQHFQSVTSPIREKNGVACTASTPFSSWEGEGKKPHSDLIAWCSAGLVLWIKCVVTLHGLCLDFKVVTSSPRHRWMLC